MRCPNCGSENAQFVSNIKNSGPSFLDGCCGFLLLGPIGLLCGFCGATDSKEEYWICKDCGKKFQPNDYGKILNKKENQVSYLKNTINKLSNDIKDLDEKEIIEQYDATNKEYDLAKIEEEKFEKNIIHNYSGLKIYKVISTILIITGMIIILMSFLFSIVAFFVGEFLFAIISFIIIFIIACIIITFGDWLLNHKMEKICPNEFNTLKNLKEITKIKKKNVDELKKNIEKIVEYKTKTKELAKSQAELDTFKKKK